MSTFSPSNITYTDEVDNNIRISGSAEKNPYGVIKNITPANWGITITDRDGQQYTYNNISIPNGIYVYDKDFIEFKITGSVSNYGDLYELWGKTNGSLIFHQKVRYFAAASSSIRAFIVDIIGNENHSVISQYIIGQDPTLQTWATEDGLSIAQELGGGPSTNIVQNPSIVTSPDSQLALVPVAGVGLATRVFPLVTEGLCATVGSSIGGILVGGATIAAIYGIQKLLGKPFSLPTTDLYEFGPYNQNLWELPAPIGFLDRQLISPKNGEFTFPMRIDGRDLQFIDAYWKMNYLQQTVLNEQREIAGRKPPNTTEAADLPIFWVSTGIIVCQILYRTYAPNGAGYKYSYNKKTVYIWVNPSDNDMDDYWKELFLRNIHIGYEFVYGVQQDSILDGWNTIEWNYPNSNTELGPEYELGMSNTISPTSFTYNGINPPPFYSDDWGSSDQIVLTPVNGLPNAETFTLYHRHFFLNSTNKPKSHYIVDIQWNLDMWIKKNYLPDSSPENPSYDSTKEKAQYYGQVQSPYPPPGIYTTVVSTREKSKVIYPPACVRPGNTNFTFNSATPISTIPMC